MSPIHYNILCLQLNDPADSVDITKAINIGIRFFYNDLQNVTVDTYI